MRKIATLLLFIGSLCAANSQKAGKQLRNCDSVFMRSDTLVCLKNVSNKLKVLKFYKDGERLFTRTVTKQKNGDIEIYTTKKRFSHKYEGEGLILHPNGQVKVRSWYKNGKVDGPSLTYYEDGKRQCVCRYKNDVRDGEQFVFYHNGQLYTHEVWKEGQLMERREHFGEQGNALEIGTLSEGNGTLIVYDDSGEKIGFMTYKNGKPTKKKVQKFPKQQ